MGLARNQLYIGSLENPDFYFENDQIVSLPTHQTVAVVGQDLNIDSFSPIVYDKQKDISRFYSSDGKQVLTADGNVFVIDIADFNGVSPLIDVEEGTPIWYFYDNELVGKFYITDVTAENNEYRINADSAIGKLDKLDHGGGLFQVTTFGAVLRHILASGLHGEGDPVIEYAIDDAVSDLAVSLYLPRDTKFRNLHQLVFAYGVNILKNIDGNPRFTFVYSAAENAEEISDEDLYDIGAIDFRKAYSAVSVTEHTYSPIMSVDPVVLFDNSAASASANEEIFFDNAPIIVSSLDTEGYLTIVSATENSAVVSGSGTLKGIPYTHSTRVISRENPLSRSEKVASITDCTAVNLTNSENLLNRLFSFYCPERHIKVVKNSIIYRNQKCGKIYNFLNKYGERENCFLSSMDITASSFNKADCEFYANYEPAGQHGLFQHVLVLDKEAYEELGGVFPTPEGAEVLEVVMISGAPGGSSGYPGENGRDAYCHTNVGKTDDISALWYGAEGGDGGPGGPGGSPGRVKKIVIENPAASYQFTIGDGGLGGRASGFKKDTVAELREALQNENPGTTYTDAQIQAMIDSEDSDWDGTPNPGSPGTATTFGEYSTDDDDAYVPAGGVYEPITGKYYALPGNKGIPGGKGGARQVMNGSVASWVTDGEDVTDLDGTVYHGGKTGQTLTTVSGLPEASILAYGGNGAGAAVGLDRSNHPHMDGASDQVTSWEVVVNN